MPMFKRSSMGIPRSEIKDIIRRMSGRLTPQEKTAMERSIFPPSCGGEISRLEICSRIGALKQERFRARDLKQKTEIDSKIKILEQLKRR